MKLEKVDTLETTDEIIDSKLLAEDGLKLPNPFKMDFCNFFDARRQLDLVSMLKFITRCARQNIAKISYWDRHLRFIGFVK